MSSMPCSPQRYLANNTNALRLAALTASSVEPIDDAVLTIPFARVGTAQVALTGSYTGNEEATYDVQIVDDTVSTNLISAPVFSGAGSGTLSSIVATGTPQNFVVELADSGTPAAAAFVDFEGVKIVARADGVTGNSIRLVIDQTGLVFDDTSFSLLDDLPIGAGSTTNGLEGSAFEWDTAVIGSDDQIPASAHRVAFGDDTTIIYLAYKKFSGTTWTYHFVPEIKRAVPKGTIVKFVTGGRDVTVTDGSSPAEDYPGIVTVFDLLEALKLTSLLVDVAGVVANDRSPTGQAARELTLRTDAHAEPSYGSGSPFATGFIDTSTEADAGTELVTATCYAITAKDNPTASVGSELWHVRGSLSGDLDDARTGVAYSADDWGFTIPRKLPDSYGTPKGRFSLVSIDYAPRDADVDPLVTAPICVVAMALGPDAVDQTITLRYTARPSGDCLCKGMPIPNLRTRCLGLFDDEGGSDMGYSAATVARLVDLYDWQADTIRAATDYGGNAAVNTEEPFIAGTVEPHLGSTPLDINPSSLSVVQEGLQQIVSRFESSISDIDALVAGGSPDYQADGFSAWDVAVAELKADVAGSSPDAVFWGLLCDRYVSRLSWVGMSAGIPQVGKTDADTIISGDGCWRDWGDAFYWEVVGSDGGKYAPAFSNHPYYSSRLATDGKAYFSTHEFAFQLNIKCPGGLEVNDTITLSIGDAGFGSTYQIGDVLTLPIIAAQPFYLAGGTDVNELQKWFVTASVDGPLAQLTYNLTDTPPISYSDGPLSFDITPGGIDFEKGDKFTFGVEGAHYKWRKNGGAWSADIAVPLAPAVFDSGLSIAFTTGAEPSFVAGDTFKFRALQPWAVSNIQSPLPNRWQWIGDTPTLVADFGSDMDLDSAAIALHTLPDGATITIEGGTSPGVYTWLETLTRREGVIYNTFADTRTARYVRLSLAGVTDAGIGWFWIGQGMATDLSAGVQLARSYKLARASAGLRDFGKYLGKTRSGTIEWSEGAISESDRVKIEGLLDWSKEHNDEAFVLVPQVTRTDEAFVVKIISDDVDLVDISDYNRDAAFERKFSARLPLAGFW